MNLASVRLRNWKAYRHTQITMPAMTPERNVVIIEGNNGAGKTSLLEALIFGLYGPDGLALALGANRDGRPDISYDTFLERALNTAARGREARMSVSLIFENTPVGRVGLTRAWHFSAAGRHRRDDEEVLVLEGDDEDIVALPEPPERDAYLREYVGRVLLPTHMAPFFLFDGEHVERLAGHDLEAQVRAALETAMDAPILRQLATDLRAYARDRKRTSRLSADDGARDWRDQLSALEGEEHVLRGRIEATIAEIDPLRTRRDDLVRRIGAVHGDSYASLKTMFEQREVHVRSRIRDQEALRRALSVDLALALTGHALRTATREQLAAEALTDQWQGTQAVSRAKFATFLTLLRQDTSASSDEHTEARLAAAWDQAWDQRPFGCADQIRHSHLGEAERHLVARQLDAASNVAGSSIADLAKDLEVADAAVAALEQDIARQRGLDEQSQALANELRGVQERIADLEAGHRRDVQALDALRVRLEPIRREFVRPASHASAADRVRQRAHLAEAYAGIAEQLVERMMPSQLAALSHSVTTAYRAMAHKDVVKVITISPDGEVALLDEQGRNIRFQDASAGENQIFALALMTAVSRAAVGFPIVLDTPLARLDPQHRANVLRTFADLGSQVILLAQPAELTGDSHDILKGRVAGRVWVAPERLGSEQSDSLPREASLEADAWL